MAPAPRLDGHGRRRADYGNGQIRVNGKNLVISVRSDISHAQQCNGVEPLFDFQRPGLYRRRLHIGLYAAGRDFASAR